MGDRRDAHVSDATGRELGCGFRCVPLAVLLVAVSKLIICFFVVDYSAEEIETFYRKHLAGQMGNLLLRISNEKLVNRLPSPDALYTAPTVINPEDERLVAMLKELPGTFPSPPSLCQRQN